MPLSWYQPLVHSRLVDLLTEIQTGCVLVRCHSAVVYHHHKLLETTPNLRQGQVMYSKTSIKHLLCPPSDNVIHHLQPDA